MKILLGEDAAPYRSSYQAAFAGGLLDAWRAAGHQPLRARPDGLRKVNGTSPEALRALAHDMLNSAPAARVHLATEGPFAQAIAAACAAEGRAYTSMSEAGNAAGSLPVHRRAARVLTPCTATADQLAARGIERTRISPGGVDIALFQPRVYGYLDLPRPINLLLGARSQSPALREFLDTPLPGSKLVYAPAWTGEMSTGPVRFISYLPATELARLISAADVCALPHEVPDALLLTLQSLACGVPVAAKHGDFVDQLVTLADVGAVGPNLGVAIGAALGANRQLCRGIATRFAWSRVARDLLTLTGSSSEVAGYRDLEVA